MDHLLRDATASDLDALADFEVVIARRSFGADAVDDHAVQRHKLAKALQRPEERMVVAAAPDGRVLGWLWFRENENFVTGAHFLNLRSLAIAEVPEAEGIGVALLEHAVREARAHGIRQIVGKVQVDNLPMRTLYRRLGFMPAHLTMQLLLDDAAS